MYSAIELSKKSEREVNYGVTVGNDFRVTPCAS